MPERAAILGAGVSGRGAALALASRCPDVRVFAQSQPDPSASLELESAGVRVHVDTNPERLAQTVVQFAPDVIVASPGIPPHSPLIMGPRSSGLRVVGEVQLAWDLGHADGDEGTPWLCVTGTNGKTTTTAMLASILRTAGLRAPAVGNIGEPIVTAVLQQPDVLPVELSSYQLATSPDLSPWASICLNIDSDHLDWHGTREEYAAAKALIYSRVQRARIFFEDEPEVAAIATAAAETGGGPAVPLQFGAVNAGALGVDGGLLIDRAFSGTGTGEPVVLADLASIDLLAGATGPDAASDPFVRDALAAAALARSIGVSPQAIQDGLARFQPHGHRRALVPTDDGIRWIDDSKATNVHAALAAARAVPRHHLVWIVGGDPKGQDLAPLFRFAADRAKALVLVGADPGPIAELAARLAPRVPAWVAPASTDGPAGYADIVRVCAEFADAGDTVLLAPGCASWDQFSSYEQRGDAFAGAASNQASEGLEDNPGR